MAPVHGVRRGESKIATSQALIWNNVCSEQAAKRKLAAGATAIGAFSRYTVAKKLNLVRFAIPAEVKPNDIRYHIGLCG